MNTKSCFRAAAAFTIMATVGLPLFAAIWSQGTPPAGLPPEDLIKPPIIGSVGKAVYGELQRSWYDWNTVDQVVTIKRRERAKNTDSWSEQIQELSTSYYVVDVRVTCDSTHNIAEVYVAGSYPDGTACLERWAFAYPAGGPLSDPYVPIDRRPLPSVRRIELFRSSQFGYVRCIEPDPDGRFVLFLTRESQTLYRRPLPSGAPTIELAPAAENFMTEISQIVVREHTNEGRQFHLLTSSRWHAGGVGTPTDLIILRDSNNDGVFESHVRTTAAQWSALGYESGQVWRQLCP